MTFLELQEAVKSDRFSEAKRANIKHWINYRGGRLWAAEPWSFKMQTDNLTLTAGTSAVSFGDFQRIFAVYDTSIGAYPLPLVAMRPEDFQEWSSSSYGMPNAFTSYNRTLWADRVASSNRTLKVVGERRWYDLEADIDEPLFPSEFHYLLVPAATAEGLRRENDPTWQEEEQAFLAGVADMRQAYLTDVRVYADSAPAWP